MGLAVDSQKGYLYSCSSDKKFFLTDLNNGFQSIEIAESQAGYTTMFLDKKNERIFLTNEAGLVSVFLTNSSQPQIVNIIQTHTANVIRGFHIDLRKYYIFIMCYFCNLFNWLNCTNLIICSHYTYQYCSWSYCIL